MIHVNKPELVINRDRLTQLQNEAQRLTLRDITDRYERLVDLAAAQQINAKLGLGAGGPGRPRGVRLKPEVRFSGTATAGFQFSRITPIPLREAGMDTPRNRARNRFRRGGGAGWEYVEIVQQSGKRAGKPCTNPWSGIGLPVLHDAALMARSIESVLEQTEPRWELLLMEDGDTERGADLMRPWLEKDTRIRYIRQSSDVGMTRLNNRLLQVASGDFFAWFTPGDCYRKDFLAESLAVLQPSGSSSQEPPVVACYPQAAFIHPVTGEETLHQNSFLLLAASPEERLRVFFSTKHAGFTASGLMRSDALRAVGGLPEDCADPGVGPRYSPASLRAFRATQDAAFADQPQTDDQG